MNAPAAAGAFFFLLFPVAYFLRAGGQNIDMENILIFVDVAAAFAVSVLCGMGVGGGGLFVIYLTLCRGVGQLDAQGVNLAFFICSAAASLCLHFRKRSIPIRRAALLGLFGTLGSIVGVNAAHSVEPSTVRICFGIMLIFAGMLVLFSPKSRNKKSSAP